MSANQPPENPSQGPGQNPDAANTPEFGPEGGPSQTENSQPSGHGQAQSAAGYPRGDPNAAAGYPQGDPNAAAGYPQGDPNQPQGVPPAGGFPPAGGAFVPPGQPPKKGGGIAKRLIGAVVAIAVALVVGFIVRSGVFDSKMEAGQCVQQTGDDSVKVVDCTSSDAQFKILGVVEKQLRSTAQMACAEWPDTTSVYWEGRSNSSGTVYCLQRL